MTDRTEPPRDFRGLSVPAAFVFAVTAFAWWRFSDNTADNDLWGHVLYGQRMLALGHVETIDPFSWTAVGAPWINHEVLAEVLMGAVHQLAGGTGLWLLAIATAALTIGLAWRAVRRECREPGIGLTFAALFAVSTNGIALGFSVRPQLFTMLALVVLLDQMRRLYGGGRWPLLTLPLLCWLWINTHGGVLAGLLLLVVATVITFLQRALPRGLLRHAFASAPRRAGRNFAVALILATAASLVTPWGAASLRWLITSVGYLRPEITEWQATPFDFSHAPFWFVVFISLAAWLASQRDRRGWEAAALAVLLAMAWRHQRHIPLFCLANLILTPPHLLDLLRRLRPQVIDLVEAAESRRARLPLAVLLLFGGGAALAASVSAPREDPWTIEVERNLFPCAALDFMADHPPEGNLLVFFDWGQQAMWALPRNPVSFDGRLDTIYPRDLIQAHWSFYRGGAVDPAVLDLSRADVALLPTNSGGMTTLRRAGWTVVYIDPLASVLVHHISQQPALSGLPLPVRAGPEAVAERDPFPNEVSLRANPGNR